MSLKQKSQVTLENQQQLENDLISQLFDQGIEPNIKQVVQKRINGNKMPNIYTHYKNLDKITDVSQLLQEPISQYQQMIQTSLNQCLTPQKLCIVNKNDQPQKHIYAPIYQIGDIRMNSFSAGLDQFKEYIEQLNLSNNNLSDKGATLLLKNLSQKTFHLDLSYNKISTITCNQLVSIMVNTNYCLREINLEGNKIGDIAATILLKGCLKQGSTIIKLNLSKNQLTEKISPLLKELLSSSHDLAELYLYWNQLGSSGGLKVAEGMMENYYLKVLDIAHNKIGNNIQTTNQWCQVFQRDSKMDLVHMDFSFNNFNYEECLLIASALESNHQIYGFHFQGHYGEPDLKGFIEIPKTKIKPIEFDQAWIVSHRIDGTRAIKTNGLRDNCWICGGWEEKTLYWFPEVSGPASQEPIYIHFSIDNYQPHLMVKNNNNNYSMFTKVFPPQLKINYFFTVLGNQLLADDQPKEQSQFHEIEIHFADITIHCIMEELNVFNTKINHQFFSKDYQSQYKCKPREKETNYFMPKKELLVIQWSQDKSVFKDWKKDDTDILNNCFETDWNRSKIERIIRNKEEIPEFKQYLRSNYKDIKDCYKYYASQQPAGEIWSINQNMFSEFVQLAKIVDNQAYFLKDSDFHFISVNALESNQNLYMKNKNNPPKQLVRHQFLEILVRLCDDKYIKTKKCSTFIEAFRQILSDGLQDLLDSIDSEQDWRNYYLWTEQNDTCLRFYKPLIDYIYRKYAGSINLEIVKNKYLNLLEFKNIFYEADLVGDKLTDRDLNMAYSLSLITQVDEINKARHTQMNVVEFMEALTRIADQLSPLPYNYEKQAQTWEQNKLTNLDLHIKLEGLLNLIYKKVTNKDLSQEFQMPIKSLFDKEIYLINEGKDQSLQGRQAIKKNSIQISSKIYRRSRVTRSNSNISNRSGSRERKSSNYQQNQDNNNKNVSVRRSQSNDIIKLNINNNQKKIIRQNSQKNMTVYQDQNNISKNQKLFNQDQNKLQTKQQLINEFSQTRIKKQSLFQKQPQKLSNQEINLPQIKQKDQI